MNISRHDLYRIILDEYIKEEGIDEAYTKDIHQKFLKHIKGDEPWEGPPPHELVKDQPSSEETYPMEKPLRAEMSQDELVTTIGELIHGKDPEEVSEIFELVFEKLPGVEIGEPEEEEPELFYTPGAEGRPVVGFQLEEMISLIKEALSDYQFGFGPEEKYDVLDPEGLKQIPDGELIDMAIDAGHEKMLMRDLEGTLLNREEIIAALKDV